MLAALATPIIHRETTKVKTNKRGTVTTTKTIFEVTGAHIVAYTLGAALLGLFISYKDGVPPEVEAAAKKLDEPGSTGEKLQIFANLLPGSFLTDNYLKLLKGKLL